MLNNPAAANTRIAGAAAALTSTDYATLKAGYRAADEVANDPLVSTLTRAHALTLRARLAVALSRY